VNRVSTSELERIRLETRNDIDGYVFSLKIYGSLKSRLEKESLRVYVERDLKSTSGGKKRPDLLVRAGTDFLIIDHKYITSQDKRTLESALAEIDEYDDDFLFDGVSFRAQLAMLCRLPTAELYKRLGVQTKHVILGYIVEREITFRQLAGSIHSSAICKLYTPDLVFPVDENVWKYKFIRQEAPLPYTAQCVYAILFSLRAEYFQEEFEVRYGVVLDQFNTLFPPWIRSDVKQLTPGRLNDVLRFLRRIGWIDWEEGSEQIVVDATKGKRMPDLLTFFIDQYAMFERRKRRARRKRAPRRIVVRERPTSTLDQFIVP